MIINANVCDLLLVPWRPGDFIRPQHPGKTWTRYIPPQVTFLYMYTAHAGEPDHYMGNYHADPHSYQISDLGWTYVDISEMRQETHVPGGNDRNRHREARPWNQTASVHHWYETWYPSYWTLQQSKYHRGEFQGESIVSSQWINYNFYAARFIQKLTSNPKVSLPKKQVTQVKAATKKKKKRPVKYVNKYFYPCSIIPRVFIDGSSLSGVLEVSVSLRHVVRGADRNSDALRPPLRHSDKHADTHTQLLKRHFSAALHKLPRFYQEKLPPQERKWSNPHGDEGNATLTAWLLHSNMFIPRRFIVVKCSCSNTLRKYWPYVGETSRRERHQLIGVNHDAAGGEFCILSSVMNSFNG